MTQTPSNTFTYDLNGNMLTKVDAGGTTQFTWTSEDRLLSVSRIISGQSTALATFKYDPFGRRIQKASTTGTSIYVYDGASIVAEYDASGTNVSKYAQGNGIDEPLATQRGGQTAFYHADGLGSITSLTDASGATLATYLYDSFGKTTLTGSIQNPFQYTGRENDSETGLFYYRARYYDPSIGRFVSEDPMRFRAGVDSV